MSSSTSDKTRPLSPHLQIYRPQITSILSITHRMTGVALAMGAGFLVLWLATLAAGETAFGLARAVVVSEIGRTALFCFAFALFYHLCNGIRHMAWDLGFGFDLRTLRLSGVLVVISALALTLLVFSVGYGALGKGIFG